MDFREKRILCGRIMWKICIGVNKPSFSAYNGRRVSVGHEQPFGYWTSLFLAYNGMGHCHLVSRPLSGLLWWDGGDDARWHPRPFFWSSGNPFFARLENLVQDTDEEETSTKYQFKWLVYIQSNAPTFGAWGSPYLRTVGGGSLDGVAPSGVVLGDSCWVDINIEGKYAPSNLMVVPKVKTEVMEEIHVVDVRGLFWWDQC